MCCCDASVGNEAGWGGKIVRVTQDILSVGGLGAAAGEIRLLYDGEYC